MNFSVLTRVASKDVRRRRGKGCRARSGGFHGKLIDFNANFSHTYSFVYFEIVYIVEARVISEEIFFTTIQVLRA